MNSFEALRMSLSAMPPETICNRVDCVSVHKPNLHPLENAVIKLLRIF